MRKKLYVDGVDLSTYGVYVTGTGTYGAPARKLEVTSIPGRNGNILGIDKSYANISVTYPCFIYASLESNLAALRAFLLSRPGYVKIKDDYHAGEYRMGIFEGPFSPTIQRKGDAGAFNLVFNCMPQRFLDSGDTLITVPYTGGTITNPTSFSSLPLIMTDEINNAEFTFNDVTVKIAALGGVGVYKKVTIDCETMECYDTNDGTSYNDKLSLTDFRFPELAPGSNTLTPVSIAWGSYDGFKILPRWWTL